MQSISDPSAPPRLVTRTSAAAGLRFADACYDAAGRQLVCVCEEHPQVCCARVLEGRVV